MFQIGDFQLVEPLVSRPGRLTARARRGDEAAVVHLAHPPSRLVRADSAFGGAAAEFFGPGTPACPVRFEARVLARLEGVAGVPRLLAMGSHQGAPWLARSLLPGRPLGAPLADPDRWTAEVLNLFSALHARGVVHRGVTLACLTEAPAGLLDFELAELADHGIPGRVGVTTPEHIAQALGAPISVDHRVDLYALGQVLAAVVPQPSVALARLIEALVQPLGQRPASAEDAAALWAGAPARSPGAGRSFAEALRAGDPVLALSLCGPADGRRVAHLAAALGQDARAATALESAPPSADLSLVRARLAHRAGAGEIAEAALRDAIEKANDSNILAASVEVALTGGHLGLAVAAAVRAVALNLGTGADLLRHLTGRLVVQEAVAQPSVGWAGALVTTCVAQGLVGVVLEPPSVVRRSFERAAEVGARWVRGSQTDGATALLLATAGHGIGAPWVEPLLAVVRHLAGREEPGTLPKPNEITRESLPMHALRLLGLPELARRLEGSAALAACFSGSSTPARPW